MSGQKIRTIPSQESPTSEQQQTQAYLEKTYHIFENNIQTYQAINHYHEFKGKKSESHVIELYYQKPISQAFKILKSSHPLAPGGMVHYKGGNTIKTRRKVLFSWIELEIGLDNPIFQSVRGYSLHLGYFPHLYQRMMRSELKKERAGTVQIDGRNALAVDVWETGQFFDPEISRERLAFDLETHAILLHEMYIGTNGNQRVVRSEFRNVRLNLPIDQVEPLKL